MFSLAAALRHWKLIALGLLFAALAVQTFRIDSLKGKLESARTELKAEKAGRIADRKAYEAAQRQAQEMNKAQVQQIERQQEQVTDEIQRDLTARLEQLRRQLRAQDKAPGGSAGRPNSPAVPQSGQGTPPTAGVCLTPEQLLRGAENEERHERLIEWVERQLGVKR